MEYESIATNRVEYGFDMVPDIWNGGCRGNIEPTSSLAVCTNVYGVVKVQPKPPVATPPTDVAATLSRRNAQAVSVAARTARRAIRPVFDAHYLRRKQASDAIETQRHGR